jgi:hypothetical protein
MDFTNVVQLNIGVLVGELPECTPALFKERQENYYRQFRPASS